MFLTAREEPLEAWVEANWQILKPSTYERRMGAGSPRRMSLCIRSVDEWVEGADRRLSSLASTLSGRALWNAVWADADRIKYVGRYMLIRLCKAICQGYLGKGSAETVWPKQGWGVRSALGAVFPPYAAALKPENEQAFTLTERLSAEYVNDLALEGVTIDLSTMAELLCGFRQGLGGRNYVGKQLDDRLPGILNAQAYGVDVAPLFKARRELFHSQALGELQGWDGERWKLRSLMQHGVIWDDRSMEWNENWI